MVLPSGMAAARAVSPYNMKKLLSLARYYLARMHTDG